MIVIAKNAENKFLDELERQKQDLSQIKCLHIEFSKSEVDKTILFDHFLSLLEQIPESYMAEVYICHDHDVFILMHAFMVGEFEKAMEELSVIMNTSFAPALCHYYSIDEHRHGLEALCREKVTDIDLQDIMEKSGGGKLKTVTDILSVLEVNLAETLSRRRSARRESSVLIIEDDQLSRTLVANTIRGEYQSISAATGTEGLNLYLENAPDAVFLDIGLPDINGHDVLRCIFKLDPNAYVIMFSGRKDKENIMRALRAGAQGFVGKPFTREKLFEYVGKSPFIAEKTARLKVAG